MTDNCPECGDSFNSKKGMRIHYSLTHGGSLKTREVTCDRCGEKTERRKTVIDNNKEVFCSKECRYNTKTVLRCEECGDKFKVYKKKANNRNHCSIECRNNSYRNGELFNCSECGTEVYRPDSQAKNYDKKFCSHKCQTDYLSGEQHYKYKENKLDYTYSGGWKKARKKRLERDNYECQECGSEENLHIHHIKPYITFDDKFKANEQKNLITLCSTCHLKYEKGSKKLQCLDNVEKGGENQ